jgi:hypothetical protein
MSILWFWQNVQLGWDLLVARRCSISGIPCIGRIGILRYVEFVHKIFSGFPKLVREFLINLCIGHPFVDVCKFELCVFLFVGVFVYLELADFTTMIAC